MHHIDNKSSEIEINLYHYNHDSMDEVHKDEDDRHKIKKTIAHVALNLGDSSHRNVTNFWRG